MIFHKKFILTSLAAITSQLGQAGAAKVYFVNQPEDLAGHIQAVNLDGTGLETLYSADTVTDFRGITIDPTAKLLYFSFSHVDIGGENRTQVSISKLPTSGDSPPEVIRSFSDGEFVADLEWDNEQGGNGWIYYAQPIANQLRKIRPDGSNDSLVLTHQPPSNSFSDRGPYFFGLDLPRQEAYWGVLAAKDTTNTPYSRGSLSGLVDPDFSLSTISRTRDIAIDSAAGRLYWCDRQEGNVFTRASSGGPIEAVRNRRTFNAPHGLAIDAEAGMAYLSDTGKRGDASEASSHRVVRFALDGSGVVEFLSPPSTVAEPWDLVLDLTSNSYSDWKTRFFYVGDTNTGPDEDYDGDGVSNSAEYAFFTHPRKADQQTAISLKNNVLSYPRRLNSDIPVRVEVSLDLETWHWNGDDSGLMWTTETSTAWRDEESVLVNVERGPAIETSSQAWFRLRALSSL